MTSLIRRPWLVDLKRSQPAVTLSPSCSNRIMDKRTKHYVNELHFACLERERENDSESRHTTSSSGSNKQDRKKPKRRGFLLIAIVKQQRRSVTTTNPEKKPQNEM
jgi:hypothetical protein